MMVMIMKMIIGEDDDDDDGDHLLPGGADDLDRRLAFYQSL